MIFVEYRSRISITILFFPPFRSYLHLGGMVAALRVTMPCTIGMMGRTGVPLYLNDYCPFLKYYSGFVCLLVLLGFERRKLDIYKRLEGFSFPSVIPSAGYSKIQQRVSPMIADLKLPNIQILTYRTLQLFFLYVAFMTPESFMPQPRKPPETPWVQVLNEFFGILDNEGS